MLVNSGVCCLPALPLVPACGCSWSVRHIRTAKKTTIKLENHFWQAIEGLATKNGQTWKQWVESTLSAKPIGINSASWLRVSSLLAIKELYE